MSVKFTNLRAFEKDLEKFARETQTQPDALARNITFQVFKGVVERTPVLTGWARANWQVTKGSPATGTTPKPSENNVLSQPQLPGIPAGGIPSYWVTNNVPYIVPLENGHSKQIGKGYMVRRTIGVIQANIRSILKTL